MMDLTQFALEYGRGRQANISLTESGPASRQLTERLRDIARAEALIGTVFWRAWIHSDLARSALASVGASYGVLARSRTIVVAKGDGRGFDLIVLDPQLPPSFPPPIISRNER